MVYKTVGLCFCNCDYANSFGEIFNLENIYNYRKKCPAFLCKDQLKNFLFVYGCMPGNLSPIMIKRDTFEVMGFFNSSFSYAGDFEFIFRASKFFDFVYIKNPFLAVRRHETQASIHLGVMSLASDLIPIYNELINSVNIKKPKLHLKLFLNENVGRRFAYSAFLRLFVLDLKSFNLILKMFHGGFNFWVSAIFVFLTLNGRIKYFRINEKSFR